MEKHVNRAENMTDTWREYGRRDKLSLAQMYNGIKYMFDLDVEEGGSSNR